MAGIYPNQPPVREMTLNPFIFKVNFTSRLQQYYLYFTSAVPMPNLELVLSVSNAFRHHKIEGLEGGTLTPVSMEAACRKTVKGSANSGL